MVTVEHGAPINIKTTVIPYSLNLRLTGGLDGLGRERHSNLIQMGITPIRIIVILLPFIGFQILGGSLFQAIGKTLPALIIMLSRQLLLLVPAVLILPLFFGLTGIWLAIPVSNFFSILITSGFVYWQNREFNRQIALAEIESVEGKA